MGRVKADEFWARADWNVEGASPAAVRAVSRVRRENVIDQGPVLAWNGRLPKYSPSLGDWMVVVASLLGSQIPGPERPGYKKPRLSEPEDELRGFPRLKPEIHGVKHIQGWWARRLSKATIVLAHDFPG
jgi:hypothetical protein